MIDHELERLHRYLDDEMSVEERTEFEALLESNDTLKAEVDLMHRWDMCCENTLSRLSSRQSLMAFSMR